MAFITADMNVNGSLEKVEIIPDLLQGPVSSSTLLKIDYPNGKDVALGNTLTPQETSERPNVFFVAPEQDDHYTLVMTDPDAPTRTDRKFGPWRHWVVVNIPGSDLGAIHNKDNQHTPYIGPGPGKDSGVHRYTFLLYKQANKNQSFEAMPHEDKPHRRTFDIKKFESDHQLELVAVNFFTCSNNE
ncbi:PEBP-like protein [Backusella circina FSU 941]|nr:PEBP-like protein [Backusella circina FSU 941]